MIAAPRAVGVKIVRLHAVGDEIFPGWRFRRDRAGGRNMISRNAIAKHGQDARAVQIGKRRSHFRHIFKVRRQLNVCGLRVPLIKIALRHGHGFPHRVAFVDGAVFLSVLLAGDRGANRCFNFLRRRPNVAEINRLAVGTIA